MRKLYVGCSLTQAPEDFVKKVEELKNILRRDWEVLDFVGLKNGTAIDVYRWDIHRCVSVCNILVAICDFPAIGLGYEMATAIEKYNKPTLGLIHKNTKVSRLVLGIDNPVYKLVKYSDFEEIPEIIDREARILCPKLFSNEEPLCDISGVCKSSLEGLENISHCLYCGKELMKVNGVWRTWDYNLQSKDKNQKSD